MRPEVMRGRIGTRESSETTRSDKDFTVDIAGDSQSLPARFVWLSAPGIFFRAFIRASARVGDSTPRHERAENLTMGRLTSVKNAHEESPNRARRLMRTPTPSSIAGPEQVGYHQRPFVRAPVPQSMADLRRVPPDRFYRANHD
jgi:hypothetical protein